MSNRVKVDELKAWIIEADRLLTEFNQAFNQVKLHYKMLCEAEQLKKQQAVYKEKADLLREACYGPKY